MLKAKTCVECQKKYTPREQHGTDGWYQRIFCSNSCCHVFRRRVRHRRPHPPEVIAAMSVSTRTPSEDPHAVSVNDIAMTVRNA